MSSEPFTIPTYCTQLTWMHSRFLLKIPSLKSLCLYICSRIDQPITAAAGVSVMNHYLISCHRKLIGGKSSELPGNSSSLEDSGQVGKVKWWTVQEAKKKNDFSALNKCNGFLSLASVQTVDDTDADKKWQIGLRVTEGDFFLLSPHTIKKTKNKKQKTNKQILLEEIYKLFFFQN